MQNLNAYDQAKFFDDFSQTEVYQKLLQDFDELSFEKFAFQKHSPTPREHLGSRNKQTVFSVVPFYYLRFLLEKNPKEIYDLGCGWNIFKKYIPNVIGVGAESVDSASFYADIHDYVDDDYIQGHQDYFESVFSICALHFHPIGDFGKVINDFYSMMKKDSRGFLALNIMRMIEQDKTLSENPSRKQIDQICRDELSKLDHIRFLVVDIDMHFLDEGMDGNVRLVMEK